MSLCDTCKHRTKASTGWACLEAVRLDVLAQATVLRAGGCVEACPGYTGRDDGRIYVQEDRLRRRR